MKKIYVLFALLVSSFGFAQVEACGTATTDGSGTSLDLYWVGSTDEQGNGNWSNPCSWRVGSVTGTAKPAQGPRPIDVVHFVDAGFTAANSIINIDANGFCAKFIMDPAFTNNVTFKSTNVNRVLEIGTPTNGGFSFADTNFTVDYIGKLLFKWEGAHTVDFKSKPLNSQLLFRNANGIFNLVGDVNTTNFLIAPQFRGPFIIDAGTFNTNNNNFNVASIGIIGSATVFNSGTSTMTTYGGLQFPSTSNRSAIVAQGVVNFSNNVINIGRNVSAPFGIGLIYSATSNNFGNINLTSPNTTYNLGNTINVQGNVTTSLASNTTIGGAVSGNIILDGSAQLTLGANLSVGGVTQTAAVNCATLNRISSTNRVLTSASNVALANLQLVNVDAGTNSASGGGSGTITYTATDVIDGGSNSRWDLTPLASRDLAWTGAGADNNWSTAANWDLMCVPNIQDNVLFANMTGKIVDLDVDGQVNNFTWATDGTTGTFQSTNGKSIVIDGNFQLNPTMTINYNGTFTFTGDANTADFSTQSLTSPIRFSNAAYTINSNLITTKGLFLSSAVTLNVTGHQMTIASLRGDGDAINKNFNANNTPVTITTDTGIYDFFGRLVFNFTNGSDITFTSAAPVITGNPVYQNQTFNLPAVTTAVNSTLVVSRNTTSNLIVNGNFNIGGNAFFGGGSFTDNLRNVTVNGDVNFTGNHEMFFPGTGKFTVTGNLNITDTGCDKPIVMRVAYGKPQMQFDVQGAVNGLEYATLANLNATGFNQVTANNSVDLGGNENFVFSGGSSSGNVYYWRADVTNPTVFNGNWNNSNHWTTTQTNTVGDGGCSSPNAGDSIVFDNLSFNGSTTTTVVPPASIVLKDFTVVGSDMTFGSTTASMFVNGSFNVDNTYKNGSHNITYQLLSVNTGGETLSTGVTLKKLINFVGSAVYTLNGPFSTTNNINIYEGSIISNGNTINATAFQILSDASTINLAGSTVNAITFKADTATNLTFTAPTTLNVRNLLAGPYAYNDVNSSGASFAISGAAAGTSFNDVRVTVNSSISGNNTFNTLEYVPAGGVTRQHTLASGSTQTFVSPGGQLKATGLSNGFITLKSNGSGQATIYKAFGDQMCWDFVILDRLDGTEDADTATPKPTIFGGLNNTTTNLGGTTFDFTRGTFAAPTVTSGPDQEFCRRSSAKISFSFTNSGPYTVNYTDGTNNYTVSGISNTSSEIEIPVNASATYTITSVQGDNCGTLVAGTIMDATQVITLPPLSAMAQNGDMSSCFLNDENKWVHFVSSDANTRAMTSVYDTQDGTSLGAINTQVNVEPSAYSDMSSGNIYMRRHTGIQPTTAATSKVRLYFTQAELDQLSVETTSSAGNISISDLRVMLYENNAMDFSGNSSQLTVTNTGTEATVPMAEALDFTSEANVYFLDVTTDKFGNFAIFVDPLVLGTSTFTANNSNIVVYPNPAKDFINVKANAGTKIKTIELFDLLGKKVLSTQNANSLNVQNISSGTYFVKVTTDGAIINKKVVIN